MNNAVHIDILGKGIYDIHYAIFDLNGTLAIDGMLSNDVRQAIHRLSKLLEVHIASSDIHNNLEVIRTELDVRVHKLNVGTTAEEKVAIVRSLGAEHAIAIGNGLNDAKMLEEAALSFLVIGKEGASVASLAKADIIVHDVIDAIDCIINPKRIVATLRQ